MDVDRPFAEVDLSGDLKGSWCSSSKDIIHGDQKVSVHLLSISKSGAQTF